MLWIFQSTRRTHDAAIQCGSWLTVPSKLNHLSTVSSKTWLVEVAGSDAVARYCNYPWRHKESRKVEDDRSSNSIASGEYQYLWRISTMTVGVYRFLCSCSPPWKINAQHALICRSSGSMSTIQDAVKEEAALTSRCQTFITSQGSIAHAAKTWKSLVKGQSISSRALPSRTHGCRNSSPCWYAHAWCKWIFTYNWNQLNYIYNFNILHRYHILVHMCLCARCCPKWWM